MLSALGEKRKAAAAIEKQHAPLGRRVLGSGLEYEVLRAGTGAPARPGREVQVRYEGRLATTGKCFDKGIIKFRLGMGEVIRGWDEGVKEMLVGAWLRLASVSTKASSSFGWEWVK